MVICRVHSGGSHISIAAGVAIEREAFADEVQPDDRNDREQPLVRPLADARDQRGAGTTPGDEHMGPEKQDQSENK